jgi:Uma2 family endonuclease
MGTQAISLARGVLIARRRKLGLDRCDEMWERVLHMPPAPNHEHQRIQSEINVFLDPLLKPKKRGVIVPGVNVFNDASPAEDDRIPDFSFVAKGHEAVISEDGIHGGPDAVVEIRSPGDETYQKLEFYAKLGAREVIAFDRDTKRPEVFRLAGDRFLAVSADREGWVTSEVLGVRLRQSPGTPPRLVLEDLDDTEGRGEA